LVYQLQLHKVVCNIFNSEMNYDRIRSYWVKGQIIITYTQAAIILFNKTYL